MLDDADLGVGTQFGAYRIESKVAMGGMSALYLATDTRLDRPVALKVLASRLARDDEFRRRFENEAKVAGRIEHPNVIPIYESGEHDGHLFIAMRYVEGSTDLRNHLNDNGAPTPAVALGMLRQAAAALDAVHRAGIVHRDVKPENFLVDAGGSPDAVPHLYLTDFGITRAIGTVGFTTDGTLVGTLAYSSPEQITGEDVSPLTDQYALGLIAFELLTGERAFRRDNDGAMVMAHLDEPIPSCHDAVPSLPASIDGILATATGKRPAERYPSCGEFVRAMSDVLQRPVTESFPTTVTAGLGPATPPEPPAKRRWPQRVAAAALVVLLIGAGLLAARGRGEDERFTFGRMRLPSGITIDRVWTLAGEQGDRLAAVTTIANPSRDIHQISYDEVVPKSVTSDIKKITFTPSPSRVMRSDPVVRFDVRLGAGESTQLRYEATTAPDGRSTERLAALASDWKRDFEDYRRSADAAASLRESRFDDRSDELTGPVATRGAVTGRPDDTAPTGPADGQKLAGAPSLSLPSDQSIEEEQPVDIAFGATAADGSPTTVLVTGLPNGLVASGGHIVGSVSGSTVWATRQYKDIQQQVFTVTVAASASNGASSTATFDIAVLDSHVPMLDYLGSRACGPACGEEFPAAADQFVVTEGPPAFISGQSFPDSTIWHQSVAPGTMVRYGSPITLTRWRDPCPEGATCRTDLPQGSGEARAA